MMISDFRPDDITTIPDDDPFWNDPDYPAVLQLRGEDNQIIHAVLISNYEEIMFVWCCELQRFMVFEGVEK